MEGQKSVADQQAEEYRARITELEAHKIYLELILKASNDQRIDIIPLTKYSLFLRSKIYHMQVQIAGKVFKVKQVEDRL